MKYSEDEPYERCCRPVRIKEEVDTDQNILLDNLQSAIDTIDDRIDELEQQLNTDYTNLTGLVNQTGIEISTATADAILNLRSEIATLESNLEQIVMTHKVNTDDIETLHAKITEADIDEANVESLDATNAEIDLAQIEHSVHNLIEATRIVVDNLEADTIHFDNLEATLAEIESLKSDSAEIKELLSEKIEVDAITGTEANLLQPNTFPQNDELLLINVPMYNGEVKLTEVNGLFSISVINTGLVTYSSPDELIYAITFDNYGAHIYLDSVGRTVSYKEIHIGEKDYETSTSEIVDKTTLERNIEYKYGAVARNPLDARVDTGWNVVAVEELPEHLVNNTVYLIENKGAVYYMDDTAYPITYVFNLDFTAGANDPIQISWNAETSTFTFNVSYEDSNNSDINFNFIEQ